MKIIMGCTLALLAQENPKMIEDIGKAYRDGEVEEKRTESGINYLMWNKKEAK